MIEQGKLAVVIGIESSDLFGCSELDGKPQCTRADIARGIRDYKRLGVRGMFIAHWVNNAFGGAALEGGAKGVFINILNRVQTGQLLRHRPVPARRARARRCTTLSQSLLQFLASFFPATKPIARSRCRRIPPGKQCNSEGLTAARPAT